MPLKSIEISENIIWTDLQDPSSEEKEQLTTLYNLDEYALYDSLEPNHLPKFEELQDMNFFIIRQRLPQDNHKVDIHHISKKIAVFYNKNFLITIHRGEVRFIDELMQKQDSVRKLKTVNALIIKIIREILVSFEAPLMRLSDEIYAYEHKIFSDKTPPHSLQHLLFLKNKANLSRKIIVLTDTILDNIEVERSERASLQDVKDLHTKLLVLYDQGLEEISSLQNIYISFASQRTNEVMKTLTIFSIFFLPLTFLAGIYGMNFKFMPELEQKWAYPACLGLMAFVSLTIYLWFKRKKWL